MRITTDLADLDIPFIYGFLSEQSTWAKGISLPLVRRAIENSLCFGGVISDFATFADLVDVFAAPEFRGKGYSKALMKAVIEHPKLQGLRRFTLATADAHGLYAQFGFTPLVKPHTFMERYAPNVYAPGI